jgi:hypothetical protein
MRTAKWLAAVATGVTLTVTAAPAQAALAPGQVASWATGKCMAIGNSSTANGAAVIQWDCLTSSPGQFWHLRVGRIHSYTVEVVNDHSGLCLAVANGSTSNGARLIQWTCNGHESQQWLRRDETFVNSGSGKCAALPQQHLGQRGRADPVDLQRQLRPDVGSLAVVARGRAGGEPLRRGLAEGREQEGKTK